MAGIRVDVATLDPEWDPLLLNFAFAMRHLDSKPISERTSWKFLGAMHGFDRQYWIDQGIVDATDKIPADLENDTYGDQCQHGTWYFLPWHRGYLAAFEAIVAKAVKELNGADWALPYWNYLDSTNRDARTIPAAFEAASLPDGSENPLRRYPRQRRGRLPDALPSDFGLGAMQEDNFLVGSGRIGFGGASTSFERQGDGAGALEFNPHNVVHGMLGGFMGNPYFAALDPLFWLHHCNIDRLWEAWMRSRGKTMTRDQLWLDGPVDRRFILPSPDGNQAGIGFTARDTLKGGPLHPSYDDLSRGTGAALSEVTVTHIGMGPPERQTLELLGSNSEVVTVGAGGARTEVALETGSARVAVTNMGASTPGEQTVRLYLQFEAMKGTAPTSVLEVYLNVPADASPRDHPELRAGTLYLFGIERASRPRNGHAGNGLGFALDITDISVRLRSDNALDPSGMSVTLLPAADSASEPVTIGKISVVKRAGTATP